MRLVPLTCAIPVFLILCLLCLAGCKSANHKPVHLTIAIDVSDLTEDRILAYASQAYRLQAQLDAGDELEVLTFAHQTDIVYRGHPIFERNQFNQAIASSLLTNHAGLHASGTKADVLLETVATRSVTIKQPLLIVVFTDGGVEDQSPQALARISRAASSASKSSELGRFVVAGVDQQWRSQWQGWLKPLGPRAQVQGMNDANQVLDGLASNEVGGAR